MDAAKRLESVCRSVGAEQGQSHRVHAVLQTGHAVHLHRVVVSLTETNVNEQVKLMTDSKRSVNVP